MGAKRQHAATERVSQGVPDVLPMNETYFSREEFIEWINTYFHGLSERKQADRLNITRRFLIMLKRGDRLPSLETYCRMLATVGAPLGTWLVSGHGRSHDN